jgi:urease accessory protein
MLASAPCNEVFAANRAVGSIRLAATATDGVSRRAQVHESGSLRVRFPNALSPALDAVIVNTAGGMAGGDRFEIEIDATNGAQLAVTTAAAEKIYRSLGAPTAVNVRLTAGSGATLRWLPQETILFDRVRLRRAIDIDLVGDAGLLAAELVVFGRTAMGETVQAGHLVDRWRIRRAGRLVFAETNRLDGAIARQLMERSVGGGGAAIATVIAAPSDDRALAAMRGVTFAGEVGVSAWNGLAVGRFVAADGAALRRDVAAAVTALGGELPRLWLN